MSPEVDARFMDRALQVGQRGLGATAPNPAVGALVVRDGEILGEGHTQPVGEPHAEVMALRNARQAGHDPRGATVYVTLEPCCHHGRTPPCTEALLQAGVARLVVGVVDPYPPMRGRSLQLLKDAGVEVVLGVRAEACARLVLGFHRAIVHGLPEVTAKAAASLDGHLATATGESRWITGAPAREHGHQLRAEHDAILVGIGTVLADDPRLTCRLGGAHEGRHPVPVVLDTELRVPEQAEIFRHPRTPVLVCADDAPARRLAADVVRVPRAAEGRGVDVEAALRALAVRGLHRVLVEGGGQVHGALFAARLVDTLHLYLGGLLLPGGRPWLAGPQVSSLADAPRLVAPQVRALGDDVLLTWSVPHRLAEGGC